MQNSSNLLDATSNKLNEKVEHISKLRKEIINYTNNFREYKLLKSDIIERFLDNENDFRQLGVILKSVTNQNNIQKETIDSLQNKIENLQNQIKNSDNENLKLKAENEELQKKIESLTISNEDKDVFVHDLLAKVNFLENVIRDYQKRIYISRYDKMFNYKSPFKNEELIKKFYDKLIPSEYKFLSYPYYLLNMKNSYNLSGKNINEENSSSLEKKKRESVVTLLKNRPKSSNPLLNSVNTEERKSVNLGNNNNNISSKNNNDFFNMKNNNNNINLNSNNNDNFQNNEDTEIIISNNLFNENLLANNNKINKKNNNSNKNINITQSKNKVNVNKSIQVENEELLRKNITSSNGAFADKNLNSNNANNNIKNNNDNNNNFINNISQNKVSSNNINSNSNTIKSSLEKERANQLSDLLLKIFSSCNISRTLKRKFGENFEIKLTDKEADPKFILLVDNEVNELIKKEKERENIIKDRLEMNRMRRSNDGRSSAVRASSPSYYETEKENPRYSKRAFNNFTKNSLGYFDPKLQYGGESCVPNTSRTRSNERISFLGTSNNDNTNMRRESKNRLSIDMENKQFHFREQQGWNSLKDFFGNDK